MRNYLALFEPVEVTGFQQDGQRQYVANARCNFEITQLRALFHTEQQRLHDLLDLTILGPDHIDMAL